MSSWECAEKPIHPPTGGTAAHIVPVGACVLVWNQTTNDFSAHACVFRAYGEDWGHGVFESTGSYTTLCFIKLADHLHFLTALLKSWGAWLTSFSFPPFFLQSLFFSILCIFSLKKKTLYNCRYDCIMPRKSQRFFFTQHIKEGVAKTYLILIYFGVGEDG